MKIISFLFFISTYWVLNAQEQYEDLKSANKEIYLLTDSLWNLEKLYVNKSIDERSYLKISGELLSALSAMAYSNASNYTRPNEQNVSLASGETAPKVIALEPIRMRDTVPQDRSMDEMKDYTPPKNPVSLITGAGRRTSFKFRYGMFWSGLAKGKSQANITYPDFKLWSSFCLISELDLLLQTHLGKENRGPWSIYYGIGLDYRRLTQKSDPQVLSLNQDKAVFVPLNPKDSLTRASLDLSFFKIPVGLQFKSKKLNINIGGYIAFRTNSTQTLEYTSSLQEEAKLTLERNYNFNSTIYGLSASIGYNHLHLAFNYDLNKLFKNNDDYDYNAWKIGLMIF